MKKNKFNGSSLFFKPAEMIEHFRVIFILFYLFIYLLLFFYFFLFVISWPLFIIRISFGILECLDVLVSYIFLFYFYHYLLPSVNISSPSAPHFIIIKFRLGFLLLDMLDRPSLNTY